MTHTTMFHFVQLPPVSSEPLPVLLPFSQYPTGISRWRESALLMQVEHVRSVPKTNWPCKTTQRFRIFLPNGLVQCKNE